MTKPHRLHILVVALTDEERTRLPLMLGYAVGARQKAGGAKEGVAKWEALGRKITDAMETMEVADA